MILVPSHQQLLNGNNLLIFIFAIILLASCGGAKTKTPAPEIITAEGRKVYNSKTGRYEFPSEVTGKVDTVKWTEAELSESDPIESDPSQYLEGESSTPNNPNGSGVFDTYNVTIMIPFNSDKTNSLEGTIHSSSLSALSYYEGAKMALEQLQREGVNMKVTVLDTKRSESVVASLLTRTEVQEAHLIIGPYSSKPLKMVAEFAKANKKPLISPVNTSGGITDENPYYLQVNPSLKSHCEAITNHALEKYSADQIVLVCRKKDVEVNRLKFFQNAYKSLPGNKDAVPFKEYIIDATLADEFGEFEILPYIKEDKTTVFIVPSYSNQRFVSNFMRQLQTSKGTNDVVVYGMPRWMDYDRISYDYYERLNLHVTSANFVDKNEINIKSFNRNFFEKYGSLPDDNVYKGYDATLYFGRQINKFGMGFVENIDAQLEQHYSTKFEFEKNIDEKDSANEDFNKVKFLENKYVNILMFKDYHFQKAE